jgi:hypothetical protein
MHPQCQRPGEEERKDRRGQERRIGQDRTGQDRGVCISLALQQERHENKIERERKRTKSKREREIVRRKLRVHTQV